MSVPLFFSALLAETFIIYASVLVKIVDISPIVLGFYRVFFAIPVFLFFAIKKTNLLKISYKDMFLMILAGLFFGADLIFFNTALHHTSVTNVNLICSLVIFVLTPIGIFFFNERLKPNFLIGAGIAILGIFILIKGKADESVATTYGDLIASLSNICYSIFLALIYSLRKKYTTMVLMFFVCIGASLVLGITGEIKEGFAIPANYEQWFYVLLIVLFGQILGQGFFGYIMGKISTQASSIILLLSPLTAAIMGFLILREVIGIFEIIGMFIMIFGVYIAKKI
ncbi:DMT family transporter [Helicobacter sp. faydin-H20]|uniref:DMT family transporter n=1 Tax=Helicobacter anatolicus TaxID=2905874 RepID=UPI001E56FEA1|nr:DMT family transporter [Helicobacter anatolicus]MCE3037629.1 DMT family transporter [Helicobacter anatolicus]